jgi:hypothetical protein
VRVPCAAAQAASSRHARAASASSPASWEQRA